MNISLLLPVYFKDDPGFLFHALESVANQTLLPDEVVVVCDGPIPQSLRNVLAEFDLRLPMRVVECEKNLGLAKALNVGISECRGEWIARFDADDICLPDRLEKQWNFISHYSSIDVLGAAIAEFSHDPKDVYAIKSQAVSADGVYNYAKSRNPLNHMTVMFRRESVVSSGLYPEYHLYEDYVLWVNMLVRGCTIMNLPDVLVLARAGKAMTDRRGGLAYAKSEISAQRYFYSIGFISLGRMIFNISIRTLVRLVPSGLRYFSYIFFLRR